jgi:hypothetical protein
METTKTSKNANASSADNLVSHKNYGKYEVMMYLKEYLLEKNGNDQVTRIL